MSSTIVIRYDDVSLGFIDITNDVLYAETTFESQMAAIPGTFRVVVSDPGHTHSFTTGREITLDVDGARLYGGYVLNVSKEYFFPADDTTIPAATKGRKWVLSGVDYNILLEKRVLYNHTNPLKSISTVGTGGIYDGAVIRTYFTTWFDALTGFNFTNATNIEDVHQHTTGYTPPTPGTTMKEVLDQMGAYGAVFYIDADKNFHFHDVQDTAAGWGFSDNPSLGDSPPTIGFREGEMTEDASAVVNDAFVWGGSEWAGTGTVVWAHKSNAASISAHNRWQYAEVHVKEENYKSQTQVTTRANVIVDGNQSGTFAEGSKGLVNPEKQFTGTWFAHDAPGSHLRPPQVVWVDMQVFGFQMSVPLRQMQISFPGLDANGNAYVQFTGQFGVLMSDPYWLWTYLKSRPGQQVSGTYAGVNNDSVNPEYGSYYQGIPTPAPDGGTLVFTIPFSYISNTVIAYLNGIAQRANIDFTESDPAAGQVTFTSAPLVTDVVYITAVVAG